MRRSRVLSRSSSPKKPSEKKKRQPELKLDPLLYSRRDVAMLFRCSVASVRRMEAKGLLTAFHPGGDGTPARYGSAQVRALAGLTE
jgi:hypothetical protein